MHRTEGANNVANLFQDGPPGTSVEEDWLNAVQEEIATVIEDAGITLLTASSEADTYAQLKAAITFMISERGSSTIPQGSTPQGSIGSGLKYAYASHKHLAHPMIIWRLSLNLTLTGNLNPVGSGGDWEVSDDIGNESPTDPLAVIESSGIFSFAYTGYWAVRVYLQASSVSAESSLITRLDSTNDNSSYTISSSASGGNTDGSGGHAFFALEAIIKVSDITLDKVKIVWFGGSSSSILGSTNTNLTCIVFEKKADLD